MTIKEVRNYLVKGIYENTEMGIAINGVSNTITDKWFSELDKDNEFAVIDDQKNVYKISINKI